ncbi:MAG: hypothetical protein U0905_10260 [Pirellulales bacterium]
MLPINIAYLLLGLYLIAGMRLGIWNAGLLVCIPVFVFIFMIFYSVSAAGWFDLEKCHRLSGGNSRLLVDLFRYWNRSRHHWPFIEKFSPKVNEIRLVGEQYFCLRKMER